MVIAGALAYTAIKVIAIGLVASGSTAIGISLLDKALQQAYYKKGEKRNAEILENAKKEAELIKEQQKQENYQKEVAFMEALGLQFMPDGTIGMTRERNKELNPLQDAKWDFSSDKALADALGVDLTPQAPAETPQLPTRAEQIAGNPLQDAKWDFSSDRNLYEWLKPFWTPQLPTRAEQIAGNPLQDAKWDFAGDKALMDALGIKHKDSVPTSIPSTDYPESTARAETMEANPLQDAKWDFSSDKALADALGVDLTPQAPAETPQLPTRAEQIAGNPLQDAKWDFAGDKALIEALGLTKTPVPETPGTENNQGEDKEHMAPSIDITDKTEDNLENSISGLDALGAWKEWFAEQQKAMWDREDAIRKETQEREDNALQRWVSDARKAGINPNLALGSQGSASGGGITQASQPNIGAITSQMNIDAEKLQQMIDQAFEGNENEKDRFMEIFGNLLQTMMFAMLFKGG